MKVPLLDMSCQHAPLRERFLKSFGELIDGGRFILGPHTQALEKSIARCCGSEFALGVSSGTDALLVALMALDVGQGDEVITSTYSFFATAGVVARLGAKPVFADIDPKTFNIDVKAIERLITPKTKAIIPVHLYGQMADMAPVLEIAKRHGLKVVEDAAQAIGARYRDGKYACSMCDIGCLSFFPTKNLGAFGDAGMVVTNNKALYEKLKILRVHGASPKYYHKVIGGNFRIDEIQSAVLNIKSESLNDWTRQRRENAAYYRKLFAETGLLKNGFASLPEAVYESSGVENTHIYNQFVVRAQNRDALLKHLAANDIGSEVYYPVPFHLQECFAYLGYKAGDFPNAESAAKETFALPIYPGLKREQQQYVVDTINRFYSAS